MRTIDQWKAWARRARIEVHAVYIAARDPRSPWYVKALALAVAAYAFSPIDLIPDFIPVLGYLDDLVLVPLGVALVIRLTPRPVWDQARAAAVRSAGEATPRLGIAAAVAVVLIWLALIVLVLGRLQVRS